MATTKRTEQITYKVLPEARDQFDAVIDRLMEENPGFSRVQCFEVMIKEAHDSAFSRR